MTPLRAVVVEDEAPSSRLLCRLLDGDGRVTVIGEARNVADAEALIVRTRPDVVFLDIELGDGDGFELLARLPAMPRVVFVTAFDAYAVRAFEVQALDYLLKPVAETRLRQALDRLCAPKPSQGNGALLVKEHGTVRVVQMSEVAVISAQGDYTELHLCTGRSVLCGRPMRIWDGLLAGTGLMRVHRSHMVQVRQVEAFHKRGHGGTLVVRVSGGTLEVPVSRACRAELEARLLSQ